MIDATAQLQEYEIRRQEREEMAREMRMTLPAAVSSPPPRDAADDDTGER